MNLYRLTTNGMLNSYRYNLQHSYQTLNDAITKVQTGRNFNSYAEDPAAASRSFQLRHEHWRTSAQIRNTKTISTNFRQACSTMDTVKNDLARILAKDGTLRGLNDPDGTGREALGQSILEAAESAVQAMNVKYSGKYLFSCADGLNAPFSWDEATGDLLFRGVDVEAKLRDENGEIVREPLRDADGNPVMEQVMKEVPCEPGDDGYDVDPDKNGTKKVPDMKEVPCEPGDVGYDPDPTLNGKKEVPKMQEVQDPKGKPKTDPELLKKLQDMDAEATYVDIGLGMMEDENGNPIKSTVYDSSLSGIEFLGYGLDADGDPKNAVMIMKKIGELLKTASTEDGRFPEQGEDYETLTRYCKKLELSLDNMSTEYEEVWTKAGFLDNNETRLTEQKRELNEQILGIEEVDPAEAITALSWAQYCYNAGLKIGTSILTQSLIDYMN